MKNLLSGMASHAIIDLAVSEAGRAVRPQRLTYLASLFGVSKNYVEKWCRPAEGETATGDFNPIDRCVRLLVALGDFCPAAGVLLCEHIAGAYEQVIMNKPHTYNELARELLETVTTLLDPEVADDSQIALTELARAKSILDCALAARRNPQPTTRRKFDAAANARLVMATRK